ncbi:enoyl-CoA hydratase/isomerase family protein [Pantoea ananatis]|uniref:enoyl-CoA hydratase/isomerase family protein n=1 Tax=Pantoea ananas TaxID=553 RepID=UPI0039B96EB9
MDPRGDAHAEAFFETEYRLDYRIHTFPKPVLCWGHGIVMGGGIGLMAGAEITAASGRRARRRRARGGGDRRRA